MAIIPIVQCIGDLKPIVRTLKAISLPLLDTNDRFQERCIRSAIACISSIDISILKIAYAALHIIMPELNTVLPLRHFFLIVYFTYKSMCLSTLPGVDDNDWRWRLGFAYHCANRAMTEPETPLSAIYRRERLSLLIPVLETIPGISQDDMRELRGQLEALENRRQIEQDSLSPHINTTEALIESLASTHQHYVDKGWFSKEEISVALSAYYPGQHTAILRCIWNYFTVERSQSGNDTVNTLTFNGRIITYDPEVRYPPFSRLCYPECQARIKAIRLGIESLVAHDWKGLEGEDFIQGEEYISYLTAFFLHEDPQRNDLDQESQDREEQERKARRASALSETRVQHLLSQQDGITQEQRQAQESFIQKVQAVESNIAAFRRQFLETLITGRAEWRGRVQAQIKRAFFASE